MMSGRFRAVVTATGAAGIGVTTFTPEPLFDITVAAFAGVISLGWLPLLPGGGKRIPVTGILLLTALLSAWAVRTTGSLTWLAPIVAGALIAIFTAQMLRRDRSGLVDRVAGQFTGALIVAAGAAWIAVDPGPTGAALTLTAAVCLAGAAIFTALPLGRLGAPLAVVAATGAGLGMGQFIGELTLLTGALIGLAAGLVVAAVDYLFQEYSDSESVLPSLAGGLIAVSACGVPVYILGRVLLHMP